MFVLVWGQHLCVGRHISWHVCGGERMVSGVSPSALWTLGSWAQRQVSLSTEPCKISIKFKYYLSVLLIYAFALMGLSNSQKSMRYFLLEVYFLLG